MDENKNQEIYFSVVTSDNYKKCVNILNLFIYKRIKEKEKYNKSINSLNVPCKYIIHLLLISKNIYT